MAPSLTTALAAAPLYAVVASAADTMYPYKYSNCEVENTVTKAPTKIVTMNQGATEFMLALGLADKFVGTAYIDDSIWPKYEAAYNKIPILSETYPTQEAIVESGADFVIANYNSAFRPIYTDSRNRTRGIFKEDFVKCEGEGSEWSNGNGTRPIINTCRPQLNSKGITTFLFQDYCEETADRPASVNEDVVYAELRTIGAMFNIQDKAEAVIDEMLEDFDNAAKIVKENEKALGGKPFTAVWLDCIEGCCTQEEGEERQVFVGGGTGIPNLLLEEASLENVFKSRDGAFVCVGVSEIVDANPDTIVLIDANWDPAQTKIETLYNDEQWCKLDALEAGRYVQVPFSASAIGPRNGPAAYDLAATSLLARTGKKYDLVDSGVGFVNVKKVAADLKESGKSKCNLDLSKVTYLDEVPEIDSANGLSVSFAALAMSMFFVLF